MKTMNVTDFKSHALQIISRVAELHETVIITKRGKALAELIPFKPHNKKASCGRLSSALISQKDIVAPIDEEWEANK
ncbi:MAG: type II toxin-antitoxin system prevent-host-death family antitoxin [Elusimicrobia bacterium]|nr:type II toxin-antitoxin system prevent-host-death family antitoxin [Candidatus Liberimonas magnetica]